MVWSADGELVPVLMGPRFKVVDEVLAAVKRGVRH